MIDMKLAREQHTPKDDNWVDMLGYAACVSDMNDHMIELGYAEGYKAFNHMSIAVMQALYERISSKS